jgi:cyclic pyranopterin phosphate synthase
MKPSHILADGTIAMVDVTGKAATARSARARALVRMNDAAQRALRDASLRKGDAFAAAQIAGIMAAKQTSALIPLTHPLPLTGIDVHLEFLADGLLAIDAQAKTTAQTGVEMEAMVAASISALTIYDMAKSVDREIVIESVRLVAKSGGKSSFDATRESSDV